MGLDGDGAGAGAAAAVGRAERLVQVHLDDVEAEIADFGAAEQSVQVSAVAVELGAPGVNHLRDFEDVLVEEAERVGEGQHERRNVVVESGGERGEVGVAVGVGGDGLALEAGGGDGRGIGAVGGIGQEHFVTRFAAMLEVGADGQDARELAVGAGRGREADGVHAGYLGEEALEPVHEGERALGGRRRAGADGSARNRGVARGLRVLSGCTSWCTSRAGRSRCRRCS